MALQQEYAKNPATWGNLSGNIKTSAIVEAEEALQLIATLGNQVPGTAAYEVGYTFSSLGNYTQAIKMFSLAALREEDPLVRAAIYRVWAGALYALREPAQARAKIASAYSVYNHITNVGFYARTENDVYTALFQVPFEVSIHNCNYARQQLQTAMHQMASLPKTDYLYTFFAAEAASDRQSVGNCS